MLSPDLNFPHFWSRLLLFDSAAMLIKFELYSMSVGQHWLDWLQQLIVSGDWEVGLGIYDHPSTVQATTHESDFGTGAIVSDEYPTSLLDNTKNIIDSIRDSIIKRFSRLLVVIWIWLGDFHRNNKYCIIIHMF
jgi:hypothetical protein